MSGIYIDGISLGENSWAIISKFFRAVVGPTDTTVEGRFVEEDGKIWLILNGERHEVTPVPDHGALIERDKIWDVWKADQRPASMATLGKAIWNTPIVLQADEEAGE